MHTCTSTNCPERTGGECNANRTWQEIFETFHDENELGGSSRWLVSPDTVKQFIKGIIYEEVQKERKAWMDAKTIDTDIYLDK